MTDSGFHCLGPFVMNTAEQIRQTIEDYSHGKNGFERAPGWESEIGKARMFWQNLVSALHNSSWYYSFIWMCILTYYIHNYAISLIFIIPLMIHCLTNKYLQAVQVCM